MPRTEQTKICPACGATVPEAATQCPACGEPLAPVEKRAWYKTLTPTEIFLLILGSIMLMIGLVAV
ncbi:putative amidophosphoribosyltransferase [Pontibacter aydingkolensis]|uniref:Zinc-ribbon domain-containing protein n=1 Tax=Pontibacter aydingkolensis TaxID=1911536 RepID=A0ABS7CR23_9BACT|nr:zinc ribbon domain-containing protein [Pontibacter aydingkolensis]MBW7466274.1 zinc-ribbon domain-containing protein [Pontibacter aydingkolensis]